MHNCANPNALIESSYTLMVQTDTSLYFRPVSVCASDSEFLAPENHRNKRGKQRKAHHTPSDKCVLGPRGLQPRVHGITEAEGHCAAHDVERRHGAALQFFVAVGDIVDHQAAASSERKAYKLETPVSESDAYVCERVTQFDVLPSMPMPKISPIQCTWNEAPTPHTMKPTGGIMHMIAAAYSLCSASRRPASLRRARSRQILSLTRPDQTALKSTVLAYIIEVQSK